MSASPDGSPKHGARLQKTRKGVKLALFLLVVAGLFTGLGWGSFSSMGIDAVAYLCPLGALETLLAAKSGAPRLFIALAVMLVLVGLFGRAFCAWACPVPPVSAFFHPKGKAGKAVEDDADSKDGAISEEAADIAPLTDDERALLTGACAGSRDGGSANAETGACGSKQACAACLAPVGGARDGRRLDTRHGVLLGALASAAVFGFPVFCLVCPVGLSIATVVAVWQAIVGHAPSWSLLVFPLVLVAELVLFRKWCHVLCPMGALMSLVGQKSLFRPRVDASRCLRSRGVDCHVCVDACPELLDPHAARVPECTKCGICVGACPVQAISMPAFSPKGQQSLPLSGGSSSAASLPAISADEDPAPLGDSGNDE